MTRYAAFALLLAACAPGLPGYAAGVPTPAVETCTPAAETTADVARITGDLVVCGELAEGDADVFTVVNTSPEGRELSVQTFGGASGCDTDTDIAVRELDGTLITSDEQLGIGPCAWVTIFVDARQAVSVEVIAVEAGKYRLAVELFDL
jgi:hypothetical protein